MILDDHNFTECGKDAAACKPKLMAFWEQVRTLQGRPASVVFEILNEPNGQVTARPWNEWAREALAIIRKSNPTRNVIIGPATGTASAPSISWNWPDRIIVGT